MPDTLHAVASVVHSGDIVGFARITPCHALQPSYIIAVQGDYSNLMKVPLISEASGVSGQIQAQFADRSVHFGEV